MKLYILRHGEAEDASAEGGDDARRLTASGRERMREIAAGMRSVGLRFDAILTSPLARASETAEMVAGAYENDPPPQVVPALSAGVSPSETLAALARFGRLESVMIVGHEPQLSGLVSILLSGSSDAVRIRLKKGGCVAMDFPNRLERGKGELRWMMTPRQLRKIRK
jgi:phosphohistidine phosphatase